MIWWMAGGFILGRWVRNNTSPAFQKLYFGAVAMMLLFGGVVGILLGISLIAQPDDSPALLIVPGVLLVIFGLVSLFNTKRRFAAEHVLVDHLRIQHDGTVTTGRLDRDRQFHVWLHQQTNPDHVHDWEVAA